MVHSICPAWWSNVFVISGQLLRSLLYSSQFDFSDVIWLIYFYFALKEEVMLAWAQNSILKTVSITLENPQKIICK
jgi:hypothetical protein